MSYERQEDFNCDDEEANSDGNMHYQYNDPEGEFQWWCAVGEPARVGGPSWRETLVGATRDLDEG